MGEVILPSMIASMHACIRYTAGLLRMISEVEREHLDRRKDWVGYSPEQMFLVEQDAGPDMSTRKFDSFSAVASEGDSKDLCSVQFSSSLSPPPRRQTNFIEGVLALPPVTADGMQQGLSDMTAQVGSLSLASQPAESSRRVAVPDLPALLSFLPLLLVSRATAGVAEGSGFGDPSLSERLRRRPSDSLHLYSTPSAKEESPPSTGLNADPNSVADMLEYLQQLQSPRSTRCSLDLQRETCGLFTRVSKLIPPCSLLMSPVTLLRLEPMELMGSRRPVPVSDALDALSVTRRKLDLIALSLRSGQSASNSQEGSISSSNHSSAAITPTSSLFYDPFAAKRRKEQDSKKEAAGLCWAVGEACTVRALLANPLSVPLLLDSVFPVFKGTARHRVIPAAAVQIPPCCDSFEVLLSVLPEEVGSMQLVGLQTVSSNANSYFEVT